MQEDKHYVSEPTSEDYLKWDTYIWEKALLFWSKILKSKKDSNGLALEIGSKYGGLSLFLAHEFGFKVICSDVVAPGDEAKNLHSKFKVNDKIEYAAADALKLQYKADTFDLVIFKSVLGSIGKNDNVDLQKKAIDEFYRVLKPGGILLFAENCKATFLHNIFRRIFRKWASYWRYISYSEISDMLLNFHEKEIRTAGVISVFFSDKKLKKLILPLDNFLEKVTPEKFRYVIYGYAIK